VGYPQLTIYPRQPKYSGFQSTIYPTTDFLKHLILSYSFEIKQINERTNIHLKFYFKIMFLSHKNVVFIIKSKSKIFINSLKSAHNLAYISYTHIYILHFTRVFQLSRVYCRLETRIFRLSRVNCQLRVSRTRIHIHTRRNSVAHV
jgi:hypothetical protein